MWQAIQYVSSGFTLAAFVVAVIAWVFKSKSEERERLIDLAKEDERADLVRDALGSIGAEAKAAIPALIEAMKVTEKEHRDNYAEPLGKSAEALANRGDTSSLEALKKAMQSLESANMEPKYITPVDKAVEDLKEQESRSKAK